MKSVSSAEFSTFATATNNKLGRVAEGVGLSSVAIEELSQAVPDDEEKPEIEPCPKCGSALIPHSHQKSLAGPK